MAIGGFNGTDESTTLADFVQMVANGEVGYYIARRRLRQQREPGSRERDRDLGATALRRDLRRQHDDLRPEHPDGDPGGDANGRTTTTTTNYRTHSTADSQDSPLEWGRPGPRPSRKGSRGWKLTHPNSRAREARQCLNRSGSSSSTTSRTSPSWSATALRYEGFDVATAPPGARPSTAVTVPRRDLVVLDVMLPDIDGFEVAPAAARATASGCRSCSSPPGTPPRTRSAA